MKVELHKEYQIDGDELLSKLIKGFKGSAILSEMPKCYLLQLTFPLPKHTASKRTINKWFETLER